MNCALLRASNGYCINFYGSSARVLYVCCIVRAMADMGYLSSAKNRRKNYHYYIYFSSIVLLLFILFWLSFSRFRATQNARHFGGSNWGQATQDCGRTRRTRDRWWPLDHVSPAWAHAPPAEPASQSPRAHKQQQHTHTHTTGVQCQRARNLHARRDLICPSCVCVCVLESQSLEAEASNQSVNRRTGAKAR